MPLQYLSIFTTDMSEAGEGVWRTVIKTNKEQQSISYHIDQK